MSSTVESLRLVREAKPVAVAHYDPGEDTLIVSVDRAGEKGYRVRIWEARSTRATTEDSKTVNKIIEFFQSEYAKEQLKGIFTSEKKVTSLVLVGNIEAFKNDRIYKTSKFENRIPWLERVQRAFKEIIKKESVSIKSLRRTFCEWKINLGIAGALAGSIGRQDGAGEALTLPNAVTFCRAVEVKEATVLGKRRRRIEEPKPPKEQPQQTEQPPSPKEQPQQTEEPKPPEKQLRPTEGAKWRPENWQPEEEVEEGDRETPDTEFLVEDPDEEWCPDLARVFVND